MPNELTVLAVAGAAALVTAMATDLWRGTRGVVLRLFHRADRRRTEFSPHEPPTRSAADVGGDLIHDRKAHFRAQTNTARDFATIFAVQCGDMYARSDPGAGHELNKRNPTGAV